jgi:hypothetical protein
MALSVSSRWTTWLPNGLCKPETQASPGAHRILHGHLPVRHRVAQPQRVLRRRPDRRSDLQDRPACSWLAVRGNGSAPGVGCLPLTLAGQVAPIRILFLQLTARPLRQHQRWRAVTEGHPSGTRLVKPCKSHGQGRTSASLRTLHLDREVDSVNVTGIQPAPTAMAKTECSAFLLAAWHR